MVGPVCRRPRSVLVFLCVDITCGRQAGSSIRSSSPLQFECAFSPGYNYFGPFVRSSRAIKLCEQCCPDIIYHVRPSGLVSIVCLFILIVSNVLSFAFVLLRS